ncbi:MAG: amidohydrolase family protein [Alphaproteobacteria bacterium]|nr:MAG: amidohydrolase family protein [Alphaproteobacteria bacterium]
MGAAEPVLIERGRVIDGTGAPPKAQAVALEDGKIAALGAKAERWAAGRNDVRHIDAQGMTVMPGLIDAHCHVTFDEPFSNEELFFHRREGLAAIIAAYNVRKVLRAGVTGLLDADCIFSVSLDLRDAIEANIVEGPRMACGGNALFTSVGGTAGMLIPDEGGIGYSRVTRTRDEIVAEVRRQIKNGVDWIKIHVTGIIPRQVAEGEIQVWTLDEMKAAADAAHELGIPVVGHCRNASSTRDAARAGFDMILHATYMDEEALKAVVEAKVPLVPTLTFQAVLAEHGADVGADAYLIDLFAREIEGSSIMLRRAYDEGVPILCGSESGFSLTPYGEWHWREMKVLVDHLGLSPVEAVSCATMQGARALGRFGELGIIDAGKPADVIVVDGDIAKDVAVLGARERLKHVFLGGRAVDLETPLPARKPIPGWRVAPYSTRPLTYDFARSRQ